MTRPQAASRRSRDYASTIWAALLVVACASCAEPSLPERTDERETPSQTRLQEVITYRACSSAPPGALMPLPRDVPTEQDPLTSAVMELVKGVNDRESALGCTSFFSTETQNALRGIRRTESGDTVLVDFRDFARALGDSAGVKSFLPPGIMAELTWTIFQFDDVNAIRFSFDGSESAFWQWLAGPDAAPEVFTRADWEQI